MRALILAVALAAAGSTGCLAAKTKFIDFRVGDCLQVRGSPGKPQAARVTCGSPESNFKVVSAVGDRLQCPTDVDSSYSIHNAFNGASSTVCLDIDWVIGGCMSIDPSHQIEPFRVECGDASVPHRQRATQILKDFDRLVAVDQCASGVGYTYAQRRFAVCVEDVSSGSRT